MENIAKVIRKAKRFLLTTHAVPDGDGLGAEMALHGYLKSIGKESVVINTHPTPAKFKLVDPKSQILVYRPEMTLPVVDVVLVLDTNESSMLGDLEEPIKSLHCPILFFDHHISEMADTGQHLIDEQYGSTGELIYSFLKYLGAEIDFEMALGIYVAIVTDSASFRFKRTTAKSHLIAAELLQKGVLPEQVYQSIYARDSFSKVRLFGHVLENIKTSEDGRIAWLIITKETRDRYQATIEDTEAFVNQLTLIESVDIGILFREEDDGRTKVSLRGNGDVAVFAIAKKIGGGGHKHAAGVRVAKSLDETIRLVCEEARLTLQNRPSLKK